MKRFTETNKWESAWFQDLPLKYKIFWFYILDKCDQGGFWKVNIRLTVFQIGEQFEAAELLRVFAGRIKDMRDGSWWLPEFVNFQYGKLSRDCKPHGMAIRCIEKHGMTIESVKQNASFQNKVDPGVRKRILDRDGLVCCYTGEAIQEDEAVVDHVIPRSKGGTNSPDNLVVCSSEVNLLKWDNDLDTFIKIAGLDREEVNQRLLKRTGKGLKAYQAGFQTLQEEEKEKEPEKDPKRGGVGEEVEPPPGFPKTQVEAITAASMVGVTEDVAIFAYHRAVSVGYLSGGVPIRSFASYAKSQERYMPNGNRSAPSTSSAKNPTVFPSVELAAIKSQIKKHPANWRDGDWPVDNPTAEQKAELKSLRKRLDDVEKSMIAL